jgi:hypothetical protein
MLKLMKWKGFKVVKKVSITLSIVEGVTLSYV